MDVAGMAAPRIAAQTQAVIAAAKAATAPKLSNTGMQLPALNTQQNVKREVLPNGATILLNSRPGASSLNVSIATAAGGLQDPPGLEGQAHLAEHMTFEGTSAHSPATINDMLQQEGGMGNAGTTPNDITFTTTVPNKDAKHAVRLFTDMYLHPDAKPYRLAKETRIVQQEMRARLGDTEAQTGDEFMKLLYKGPEKFFDPIGSVATTDKVTPGTLKDFYAQAFTGANTVAVLDGDPKSFPLEMLRAQLGKLPKGTHAQDPADPPRRTGALIEAVPHGGTKQANITIAMPNRLSIDTGPIGKVLGAVAEKKIMDAVREHGRLTYTPVTHVMDSNLVVESGFNPAELKAGVATIAQTLRRLPATITDQDVTRAKQDLLAQMAIASDDPSRQVNRQMSAALEGVVAPSEARSEKAIGNVTPDIVRELAKIQLGDFGDVKVLASGSLGRDGVQTILNGFQAGGVDTKFTRVPFHRSVYAKKLDTPTGTLKHTS